MKNYWGLPSEELLGRHVTKLHLPEYEEAVLKAIDFVIENGHNSIESLLVTKDGRTIPFYLTGNRFEANNQLYYLGFGIDITEQKQMESELINAKERAEESDRLKSAFLANMSHEIRTPMNGILGFANLLKEPGLTGEEQQNYLSIIEKSGARMLNIINEIIDISKIESGQMLISYSNTNINKQVDDLFSFFKPDANSKSIEITYLKSLPGNNAIVQTDSEKLYAILSNLIKNAIKYTNSGSIEFGYTVIESEKSVSLKRKPASMLLEYYVKDTGIGISKDRQEAVFERFVQADIEDKMARQGAGLGLTISRAYVEMLGGKIWVESEPGKGTVFYFTSPM